MDWATRKLLSCRVSNTMDVEFCIEALQKALVWFVRPKIFNSDQGCQWRSYFPQIGRLKIPQFGVSARP